MAHRPVQRPAHQTSAPSAGCVVVGASPGFAVLTFFDDPDGGFITETPIVAWRIEADYAMPITPDPDGLGSEINRGIVSPHGSVVVPGMGSFRNEQEWLDYVREATRKRA